MAVGTTPREIGTVLVTGAASGLGAAVVDAVGQAGGRALAMDKEAADGGTDFEAVDLGDTRAAERAVRALAERNGGVDAVVTAAGTDCCGPLDEVSATDWERVVQVNLLGTVAVVRAALPYLERVHGRVITVGSSLGLRPAGDASAYCASKFGVHGFTQALAMETAGRVGVTLLVPAGMRTRFFEDRAEQYRPPDDSKLNAPENVAASVLHALRQPEGCEVRELVICHELEGSWP